jgi:small subunit ribosomal protein S16
MATVIRLRREGTKNRPFFRIVATDSRMPRDGRFLELLGTYDPLKEGANYTIKKERIEYWLSTGAKPSDTVRSILKRAHNAAPAEADAPPA